MIASTLQLSCKSEETRQTCSSTLAKKKKKWSRRSARQLRMTSIELCFLSAESDGTTLSILLTCSSLARSFPSSSIFPFTSVSDVMAHALYAGLVGDLAWCSGDGRQHAKADETFRGMFCYSCRVRMRQMMRGAYRVK